MKKEILRKIFHIISILFLLLPLYVFGKYSIVLLMTLMLVIFYPISSRKIKNFFTRPFWLLMDYIERERNMKTLPAKQAFSLALGLIIISIIFSEKIIAISIISLAIYDGIATIVGKLFGKVKLINNRTLEGTVAGIIANSITLSVIIPFWIGTLISIFVAIIELFSKGENLFNDDNFLIPVGTAIFTWYLMLYLRGISPTDFNSFL